MRERRAILAVVLGALLVAFPGAALAQSGAAATAELEDTDGNPVGEATFTEGPDGVTINASLEPGQEAVEPGERGIHIHETGDVSPDFEAAGEHLNPESAEHGFDNSSGPHAGDLENITVDEDGSATYTTTTDRFTLSSGENGLLDSDGSTLIIHQSADDYQTDPSGETGDRVAAGVVEGSGSSGSLTKTGGVSPPTVTAIAALAATLLAGAGALALRQQRRA